MTDKQPASDPDPKPPAPRKAKAPRPDQMSQQTFAFIAAVDHYKRIEGKSFLSNEDVLEIVRRMGYARPPRKRDALREYERALAKYRKENERLFPNWSEVFEVVLGLGYRPADAA
jgi:hypothetical protein